MAVVFVDGSSKPQRGGWGAAACVVRGHASCQDKAVTLRVDEQMGCAAAEAYALLAGIRLLRRCQDPHCVVVDRSSVFSNIVSELGSRSAAAARDPIYADVIRVLLQDLQDAADRRNGEITVLIVTRIKAAAFLGSTHHMRHKWAPHALLEEAWAAGNNQVGALGSLPRHRPGSWNISVVSYASDDHLELLAKPSAPQMDDVAWNGRGVSRRAEFLAELSPQMADLMRFL